MAAMPLISVAVAFLIITYNVINQDVDTTANETSEGINSSMSVIMVLGPLSMLVCYPLALILTPKSNKKQNKNSKLLWYLLLLSTYPYFFSGLVGSIFGVLFIILISTGDDYPYWKKRNDNGFNSPEKEMI